MAIRNQSVLRIAQRRARVGKLVQMVANVVRLLAWIDVHQIKVHSSRMINLVQAGDFGSSPIRNRAVGSSEHHNSDAAGLLLPEVEGISVQID